MVLASPHISTVISIPHNVLVGCGFLLQKTNIVILFTVYVVIGGQLCYCVPVCVDLEWTVCSI
jgi:hypothetical protein